MSEPWIMECNAFLKQIRESMALETPDRLALVKSINRALHAVNHSILGWFQYANNPDIMSKFDRDELQEISDAINKFAEAFIEHDIKVTKKGMGKGLEEPRREDQDRQSFYV